jgi:hypothetical protein
MYKIYKVYKNTGDWGGSSDSFQIAENEIDAMIQSFRGSDKEEQGKAYKKWIEYGYDIYTKEANSNDFLDFKLNMIKLPEGYKLKCEVNIEIVEA